MTDPDPVNDCYLKWCHWSSHQPHLHKHNAISGTWGRGTHVLLYHLLVCLLIRGLWILLSFLCINTCFSVRKWVRCRDKQRDRMEKIESTRDRDGDRAMPAVRFDLGQQGECSFFDARLRTISVIEHFLLLRPATHCLCSLLSLFHVSSLLIKYPFITSTSVLAAWCRASKLWLGMYRS